MAFREVGPSSKKNIKLMTSYGDCLVTLCQASFRAVRAHHSPILPFNHERSRFMLHRGWHGEVTIRWFHVNFKGFGL